MQALMMKAADDAGIRVLGRLPEPQDDMRDHARTWIWLGDAGTECDFINIAKLADVRIIYTEKRIFYLDAILLQSIANLQDENRFDNDVDDENDDREGESPILIRLRQDLEQWKKYDGKPAVLIMLFWHNGVIHDFREEPDWFTTFNEEMEEAITPLKEAIAEENRQVILQRRSEYREKAETLARDERYARAKNEGQRKYITENMYPDIDFHETRDILELAANIYWEKVEPELERQLTAQVAGFVAEGLNTVQITAKLGLSKEKINRLMVLAEALSK